MKSQIIQSFILIVMLLFLPIKPWLQTSNCIKLVQYDQSEFVFYTVSPEVEITEMHEYDILKARSYQQNVSITKCINSQFELTVTKEYDRPAFDPDTWVKNPR